MRAPLTAIEDELLDLRDTVIEQAEIIARLKAIIAGDEVALPEEWGLTRTQKIVFLALWRARGGMRSRTDIIDMLPDRSAPREERTVDGIIKRLRPKLAPHGLKILTSWAEGYRLPPETMARLDAIIGGRQR